MIWLLLACGRPPGLAGCDAVADATAREECRFEEAQALLGDRSALEAALGGVEPATSRDLLRLRLAVADPRQAGWLCEGVSTDVAREKCRQVLGRPHLQAPRKQR